ncbi:MAG TPA: acyl-CoA dehydratase activase-related protein [Myxococcales bacterium]|jgi:predicted CoA-substrate-specific enzyme activase
MSNRFVGLDIGAETIKAVELKREGGGRLTWTRRALVEHHKEPAAALKALLADWGWDFLSGAAATGRLARLVGVTHVPTKQAQSFGYKQLFGESPATVVSIGSHGFSVLEVRPGGVEIMRENSRCSQGTGNFLRQLVERFDLDIEQASELCADVEDPAPLSGRCPVILKTDMTHLANKGENRARILAGLFDAVCENVQVLVKPRLSPDKLLLVGGVSRSRRIRENFRRFAAKHAMELVETLSDDALYFEALGSAVLAADRPARVPTLDRLVVPAPDASLERVPALAESLSRVKRMPPVPVCAVDSARDVILGFDIGSTGSKTVAIDAATKDVVWEGYLKTNGNPVGAAQELMKQWTEGPAWFCKVKAVGATGSGREIVGSLMANCYGGESVYVLNEIAAHAEGALHFDPRVDTIFEIGGQDAKYIRLADGRVVDAAMNEACSAGTGSFIEEQGKKFSGISSVVQLGGEALKASSGVSLGQHCSVFMAEIIDDAVAAGTDQRSIIAGIYDSIIQNYLNRVKGSRSVGQVIFCQGMPFAADALAAAVVRQTGAEVIVPPNPGTVGAMGIALLTLKNTASVAARPALDPARFLSAQVEKKDTFVCNSTKGCGGAGNKCRIDRITTLVGGDRNKFTWGGGCSLYDKGTRKKKLPDLTPDPFREREEMLQAVIARVSAARGNPTVGITDEFALKGLFPFFAHFLFELGFDLKVKTGADHHALKRGIEEANVPFCAPVQQFHGLVAQMAEQKPDYLFLPMLREYLRVRDEEHAVVCPLVQAGPDMLRWDLGQTLPSKLVTPLIDIGTGNLESPQFLESCRRIASDFGIRDDRWRAAYFAGVEEQRQFDAGIEELGRRALDFCTEHHIVPVVVLGRAYTIYNTVLNSNVPAILREQGAIAIPVDCFPVPDEVPIFYGVYWSFAQKNLRAAHHARRTPGVYTLYCSNYSCGPDSFALHFYSYLMEGKPFAVIETDGHSGDAGTKTRVEAFLHCVAEDLSAGRTKPAQDLKTLAEKTALLDEIKASGEILVIPRMGPGAEAVAAAMRGLGIACEALAMPDRETMRMGRRYTSGKECVPMTVTLGSMLQRVASEPDKTKRFAFAMPKAYGPCRFGVYNILHKIVFQRLGLEDRVRIWSPSFQNYFAGLPDGFPALIMVAFMGSDLLLEAHYDARVVEKRPGLAREIFDRYHAELMEVLEEGGRGDMSAAEALVQVASGRLFGVLDLLSRAAEEFAAAKQDRDVPAVMMVGEIYVRNDPFANDFVADKLAARGIRVRFAPFNEWIEYADYINFKNGERTGLSPHISSFTRAVIQSLCYSVMAQRLGWPHRTTVQQSLAASNPYVREEFQGESVLTVGGPVHEWREGLIDGVISVGPLECLPNKISENQFAHIAEKEGLLSLTLSLNGDPIAPEALENFVFEVHARYAKKPKPEKTQQPEASSANPLQATFEVGLTAAKQAVRLASWAFPGAPQGLRILRRMAGGTREETAPQPLGIPKPPRERKPEEV